MASSEVINPAEYLYDPWELILVKDWIANYVKFSKISPEFQETFNRNPSEFRMIPIPASLFNSLKNLDLSSPRLTASSFFPGMGFSDLDRGFTDPMPYFNEKISRLETIKHYDVLANLVLDFSKSIESGEINEAMAYLSDDYLDFKGRTKENLSQDIQNLLTNTENRKLILTNADEFRVIGDKVYSKVSGAWQGTLKDRKIPLSETFNLEFFFQLDKEQKWKIYSIEVL